MLKWAPFSWILIHKMRIDDESVNVRAHSIKMLLFYSEIFVTKYYRHPRYNNSIKLFSKHFVTR